MLPAVFSLFQTRLTSPLPPPLANSLQAFLAARGYPSITLIYPPPALCTDNAAMIAWAGIEMFRAGHTTPLVCRALRKWSLEELLTPPNGN